MVKIQLKVLAIVLFITAITHAQNVKFGKVSKEELAEKVYEKDSSAAAVVLYRKENLSFDYGQSIGFTVVTYVHERIKIYTKEGFDYATISERLYKSGSDNESVSRIKAVTYNLENGEMVSSKLKKSDVFSTEVSKYYNEEKFTMPNVKEGSVIEYQYYVESPFYYSIDEIPLQYDIPIKQQEISIATPEYYSFKPNMKGYLNIQPKYTTNNAKITFNNKQRGDDIFAKTEFSTSSIDYKVNKTTYAMVDVPALKEEPYVNAMDNYRSAVNYELQSVELPQSLRKNYTTTWEEVIKTIYDGRGFGDQIGYSRYYKDDLEMILAKATSDTEKIASIFSHVQQRMNWNSYLGYSTDKGVKEAYNEKSGNIADINLILLSMLKKAGLKANPVLLSTRDHGVPLFPTREGFNYVVASVDLEGQTILLDASNKYTKPNLLPTRALNWYGRIIKEDRTSTSISVIPEELSKENNMLSVELEPDGKIKGKIRNMYWDYLAYSHRNNYNNVAEEAYLEKLENKNNGMEISDYSIKNDKAIGKPIIESYAFVLENQAEVIGDKIYISPMLNLGMKENPFKSAERNFPIDFTYPREQKCSLTIKIPEGYEVTSIPDGANFALEGNVGSFVYQVVEGVGSIQVMMVLKINKAVLPVQHYEGIKELFKKAIEKETEKVVLSKT